MPQNINIDINALLYALGTFVGGLFIVLWYLIRQKFKDIENKRDKETCDEIHSNTEDIDKKRDKETCDKIHISIDTSIEEMKKNIGLLLQHNFHDFSRRQSSRQLNEEGWIIFKHSEIKELIDENIPELFDKISEINPKNYYEVEFQTEKIINNINNENNLEKLKSCAEKVNLPIKALLFIGSVYLSNEYLKKRPELLKDEQDNK